MIEAGAVQDLVARWWWNYDEGNFEVLQSLLTDDVHFSCRTDTGIDDHNVDRFCDLLDEMTRLTDTRFVIITHNPITMARMNRLYGVTMAERGVSQLVSVDLETAARIREAV